MIGENGFLRSLSNDCVCEALFLFDDGSLLDYFVEQWIKELCKMQEGGYMLMSAARKK